MSVIYLCLSDTKVRNLSNFFNKYLTSVITGKVQQGFVRKNFIQGLYNINEKWVKVCESFHRKDRYIRIIKDKIKFKKEKSWGSTLVL